MHKWCWLISSTPLEQHCTPSSLPTWQHLCSLFPCILPLSSTTVVRTVSLHRLPLLSHTCTPAPLLPTKCPSPRSLTPYLCSPRLFSSLHLPFLPPEMCFLSSLLGQWQLGGSKDSRRLCVRPWRWALSLAGLVRSPWQRWLSAWLEDRRFSPKGRGKGSRLQGTGEYAMAGLYIGGRAEHRRCPWVSGALVPQRALGRKSPRSEQLGKGWRWMLFLPCGYSHCTLALWSLRQVLQLSYLIFS